MPRFLLWLALVLPACKASEGEVCRETRECADGLVCLRWEDSDQGSCLPRACAEHWTGYG